MNDLSQNAFNKTNFLQAMKNTARARFKAHKRLTELDIRQTTIVSLSTAFIIVLTAAPYIIKCPTYVTDALNLFTIAFSIVILVYSLLQYSSQNALAAEQFHRSALEINELRRALEMIPGDDPKAAAECIDKYNTVLQKYSINHKDVDFHSAILEKLEEYPWVTPEIDRRFRREIFFENLPSRIILIFVCIIFITLLISTNYLPESPPSWLKRFANEPANAIEKSQ